VETVTGADSRDAAACAAVSATDNAKGSSACSAVIIAAARDASCAEKAVISDPADKAKCAQVANLANANACNAVIISAAGPATCTPKKPEYKAKCIAVTAAQNAAGGTACGLVMTAPIAEVKEVKGIAAKAAICVATAAGSTAADATKCTNAATLPPPQVCTAAQVSAGAKVDVTPKLDQYATTALPKKTLKTFLTASGVDAWKPNKAGDTVMKLSSSSVPAYIQNTGDMFMTTQWMNPGAVVTITVTCATDLYIAVEVQGNPAAVASGGAGRSGGWLNTLPSKGWTLKNDYVTSPSKPGWKAQILHRKVGPGTYTLPATAGPVAPTYVGEMVGCIFAVPAATPEAATACEAVRTAADDTVPACTYTPPVTPVAAVAPVAAVPPLPMCTYAAMVPATPACSYTTKIPKKSACSHTPAKADPTDKASCTQAKGVWLPCNVPGKSAGTCGRTPLQSTTAGTAPSPNQGLCPSGKMTSLNKAQCLADGSVYDDIADTAAARDACLADTNNKWLGENCVANSAADKKHCASLLKPAQIADSVPPFGTTGTTHKCASDPKCTYTPASAAPKYGDYGYFGPSFATGAQVAGEGTDVKRADDLWTPKNPLTVTSLQFECKAPPLFMDYWSVFGIPRAPRTDYSKLDATKCDGGERPIVADKAQQTNRAVMCGPRGAPKCGAGKTFTRYGECGYTSKIGDGICDPEFNHAIFLYDELDCFYSAMQEISGGTTLSFSGK
jgi:hypothetical protein